MNVALKAAEVADSAREEVRRQILGEKESLDNARLALKLIVGHAAGTFRSNFEALLQSDETAFRERLQANLAGQFPSRPRSFSALNERFNDWMRDSLANEMASLSGKHRAAFVEPVQTAGRQLAQSLEDFRSRLSNRTLDTLGVPLQTTELELHTGDPKSPDVRVEKIFDHNWDCCRG